MVYTLHPTRYISTLDPTTPTRTYNLGPRPSTLYIDLDLFAATSTLDLDRTHSPLTRPRPRTSYFLKLDLNLSRGSSN